MFCCTQCVLDEQEKHWNLYVKSMFLRYTQQFSYTTQHFIYYSYIKFICTHRFYKSLLNSEVSKFLTV